MGSNICPNCFNHDVDVFYISENVPVNSVIQVPTRAEAFAFPLGDIHLGFCHGCGLIFNAAFISHLTEYSERYESTQRHSEIFSKFNQALAEDLIERHDLVNKRIIEIGCGEGEFLYLLCQTGKNKGVGFDPAYTGSVFTSSDDVDVLFIPDYFSEKYVQYQADYYVCKMTLEHIQDVAKFVSMIRETIGDNDPTVFFQVPNFEKSLKEGAFWDVYYEHCSYFTSVSLRRCFENNGFVVTNHWMSFEDQYLMLETVPLNISPKDINSPMDLIQSSKLITSFRSLSGDLREAWSRKLSVDKQSGKKTVIWGASSKGVSFLTTLETRGSIEYAVDINPDKRGMFIPGSGQEIVGPQDMRDIRPDTVIVMNSVYTEEIQKALVEMELSPTTLSIERSLA